MLAETLALLSVILMLGAGAAAIGWHRTRWSTPLRLHRLQQIAALYAVVGLIAFMGVLFFGMVWSYTDMACGVTGAIFGALLGVQAGRSTSIGIEPNARRLDIVETPSSLLALLALTALRFASAAAIMEVRSASASRFGIVTMADVALPWCGLIATGLLGALVASYLVLRFATLHARVVRTLRDRWDTGH